MAVRIAIYGNEKEVEEWAKELINDAHDKKCSIAVGKARRWLRGLFTKQVVITTKGEER